MSRVTPDRTLTYWEVRAKLLAAGLDRRGEKLGELPKVPTQEELCSTGKDKLASWNLRDNLRRRKRRGYHRAMSGLRVGGSLRFVTLTHSMEAEALGLSIQSSFRALVARLRRRKLLDGYFKVIEYTKKGYPHIHMIYRGRYVAQSLLSTMWSEIHKSPVVHVRRVVKHKSAAWYVAKYLGKDERSRYSWSWSWVWKGFVKQWKTLVKDCLEAGESFGTALATWEYTLDRYAEAKFWKNLEAT